MANIKEQKERIKIHKSWNLFGSCQYEEGRLQNLQKIPKEISYEYGIQKKDK